MAAVVTKAKYGDESVYFDLDDVESTTGSWDVYGEASPSRYPSQQAEFFERAGSALARREAMLAFLAMGGTGAILTWGAIIPKGVALPIAVGAQAPPTPGPR